MAERCRRSDIVFRLAYAYRESRCLRLHDLKIPRAFNAFNAKELGLNKAMHLLGLKRPSPALEVTDISNGCSINDMALIAYALEFIQFIPMLERLGFGT